ncbi:MAG TPA: excinuclease ABC subunit UvrC [Gammaproteobacteria bacterium]|nr:excinuclease ABC subunit UvrC [Gammaproteobacteria bacterium]
MSAFDPKAFIETLPTRPGIYQMMNAQGQVLYVGKARNLKDRVSSYFRAGALDTKTIALVQKIDHMTVTVTHSENEALLLESNLIKKLRPRYNILLRDDKSYPYLFLSAHRDFPRLTFHRGPEREKGEYFGPYPSAAAVHETLDVLQKLFKIRQCSDPFFKSRTRPCLQYQIKRCTAPCVGYVDVAAYQEDVQRTRLFLRGKNEAVMQELINKMEQAASRLEFEAAAHLRDTINIMRQMQARQAISTDEGDVDVIAVTSREGAVCIEVLYIRNGRLLGNKSFFPKAPKEAREEEVLTSFLPQYYLSAQRGESFPDRIYVNLPLADGQWIIEALSEQWQRKVVMTVPTRGFPKQWINMALLNARHSLVNHLSSQLNYYQWLEALQKAFKLPGLPQRLECFDISHTMGEATVASCVVFGTEGPIKDDYRRFNIRDIQPGDDYAAMQQALERRYTRIKATGGEVPDILIIDGGKGQLSVAEQVLEELQVVGVTLLAVAKGPTRKPGLETIFLSGHTQPWHFEPDSVVLHLIQRIRDEAHRFAITGHRQQRAKARTTSPLEAVPGIGPTRRREILKHFGGLQGVMRSSVAELAKVPGISLDLAQRLYDSLHGE